MNYKKLTQIVVIAVAALWVFCIVTVISVKVAQQKQVVLPELTEATAPTAFAPATTAEETTASAPLSVNGNNITTAPEVDTPQWLIDQQESSKAAAEAASTTQPAVPKSKTEVIDAYVTAVNNLKNTANFSLVKKNVLNVEIDEILPNIPGMQSIASTIIDNNTNNEPQSYRFTGGIDTLDPSSAQSPDQVIAPLGQAASLSADNVKSATAKKTSSGYTVKIELGKQEQTLTSPAPGYSTIMQTIDIETLGLPSSITVSELNITYNNSSIEAEIDKSGRITSMTHYLQVESAEASGRYLVASANIKLHGDYTGTYSIEY